MKAVIKRGDLPGLVMLVIIGLGLTILGTLKLKNAAESNNWPVTSGIITGSRVGGAIKYYPALTYTYTVDSTVYTSDRIANMNFLTKNQSVAEEVLNRYPLNSEVKVYYQSTDPSKAFLEPGIQSGNFLLLAIGLFILAVPILTLVFMKLEIKKDTGRNL